MEKLLQKVLKRIVEHYQPKKVILFGSYARGHERSEIEDVDLVVLAETVKTPLERIREATDLLEDIEEDIDIFIYTPEEYRAMKDAHHPFIESIERSHKVLYQK